MRERMLQLGCTDIAHWQRWAGRIRLTRNGLAVITLDQSFEDISLIACTEQIPGAAGEWRKRRRPRPVDDRDEHLGCISRCD